jgi:hypothetical protein
MQRKFNEIPEYPFNTFYALCLIEADRLEIEPEWDTVKKFPTFSEESVATLENERFDVSKCHQFVDRYNNSPRKKYKRTTHRSKYGPTFNEGVNYWKYGKEYKYPDQALDEHSNPTKPDPTYTEPPAQDDPSRYELDQIEQLKKAIRSGKINKKGLGFLRNVFIDKLELLQIIDAYIDKTKKYNEWRIKLEDIADGTWGYGDK